MTKNYITPREMSHGIWIASCDPIERPTRRAVRLSPWVVIVAAVVVAALGAVL